MAGSGNALTRWLRELRRRRVFRTAGLYVVGAWLVMQVADLFFPGWGLPDSAINILLVAAVLGFPLALVFGWFFDVTAQGIVRTSAAGDRADAAPLSLQRTDYWVLAALALIAVVIVYDAVTDLIETPQVAESGGEIGDDEASPEKPDNSIAVLPFANVSNDPDNEAFCDGISEEILHKLAEFGELHVIGRTSSFAFKGSDYRIPRISALLGVRYLLQGSVRKVGDRLRISAQLVDDSGAQRWSEAFDRRLEDVFAIQTEIADFVATTVVPKIVPQHDAVYQPDIVAYQHYLAGRELLHRRNVATARAELAKAVELDPGYAEAWAEYAISLAIWENDPDRLEVAWDTAEKALALKPGLPRARAAHGLILAYDESAAKEAETILRGVLADEPHMVDASNWLAQALGGQGRDDEAFAVLEKAMAIDPIHPAITMNAAFSYHREGDSDRAIAMVSRLAQLPEPSGMVLADLVTLYRETGRFADMLAAAQRLVADGPAAFNAWIHLQLAVSYALLGNSDRAAEAAEAGRDPRPEAGMPGWGGWLAVNYLPAIWRGDYVEGRRRFEAAATAGGVPPSSEPLRYGVALALAGDHARAVELLEPALGESLAFDTESEPADYQTLAWSLARTGQEEGAANLLDQLDRHGSEVEARGGLESSAQMYSHARTALLRGDADAALARLRRAVNLGWRDYYLTHHDPRMEALSDDPRYQALMAEVRADVDRQAAEIASRESAAGAAADP
jgi:TolB-like protein/Tfp pilus assembly protein PilF